MSRSIRLQLLNYFSHGDIFFMEPSHGCKSIRRITMSFQTVSRVTWPYLFQQTIPESYSHECNIIPRTAP